MESLGGAEFAPQTNTSAISSTPSSTTSSTPSSTTAAAHGRRSTYLNTASMGLAPARTTAAIRRALDDWSAGDFDTYEPAVIASRESFARLTGISADRVAVGSAVSVHTGLIAASLPSGAEVLIADGDFSSLVHPFAQRRDLKVRSVPLERLAAEVRPGTALVAVSFVQSADGRVADLAALRAAAAEHGTRTLIDGTQGIGWLPICADDFDYVVCGAFKWLLAPRGVSFLTVSESAAAGLDPMFAGWYAGEDPWVSCYGPIAELASSARRFDSPPGYLSYIGAEQSLAFIEELGVERIGRHNLALAERFRAGLAEAGLKPLGDGGSSIVSVPGLGHAVPELERAGIRVADRAGHLRVSFHLYNTAEDVDRLLAVLREHAERTERTADR